MSIVIADKPQALFAEMVELAREAVDEIMQDMEELGFAPTKAKQKDLREYFEGIATSTTIEGLVAGREQFIAEFGETEWQKQSALYARRNNGR